GAVPGGSAAGQGSSAGNATAGASAAPTAAVQGLVGALDEIRIHRGARPNWLRASRDVAPEETSTAEDWPATVRYYFVDGDRMTPQQLAERGLSRDEVQATATGLYRETTATAALSGSTAADEDASIDGSVGAKIELLAPEVVKLEFGYADGEQFLEAWDSSQDGKLPAGVEIKLTIYDPPLASDRKTRSPARRFDTPRYVASELVEYRRFVRLPTRAREPSAELLLPVQQAGDPTAAGGGPNAGSGSGLNGSNGQPPGGNVPGGDNGGRP
ncbi:MAG: hypothetical protein DCC67_20960, partial [Planctomycetota bacterium]